MNYSITNSNSNSPIFIVGTSRSGTTLLRNILNKHSEVWIPDKETNYFADLRVKMAGFEQQPLSLEQAKLCQDYFLALTHKGYDEGSDPEQGWMNRKELQILAESLGVGADSYFEAFCQLCAQRNYKIRWGEKTPKHVFHISEILTRYPQAQVVCTIRHPGGVISSFRDKWKRMNLDSSGLRNKNSYNLLITSLIWRGSFKATLEARKHFGSDHIYIQRFEDLLAEPESAIKALTAWLSLDYQPSMIEVSSSNSSYLDLVGKTGFSQKPMYHWREKLSEPEIAATQYFCGYLLKEAGYEPEPVPPSFGFITWLWITSPLGLLRTIFANHRRITNIPQYIWRRFRIALLQRHI